jgi:hypothetical protein
VEHELIAVGESNAMLHGTVFARGVGQISA